MKMTIRRAEPSDHASVVAMNRAMAKETEDIELPVERTGPGVQAVFDDPGSRGYYLLAERHGVVVGQLMITYEWSDWRNGWFWWIQSVYVLPQARRQGVYRALYQRILDDARGDDGVCGVRLYVHHDNTRAMATYEALGMRRADYQMYELDFVLHDS